MTKASREPIILTEEQADQLPNLVSLAMVGLSLLRVQGETSPVEGCEEIAPFMPLVAAELAMRKARRQAEIRLRYSLDDMDDEEDPKS